MVILRTIYYWTILISLTTIFLYFTLVNVSINQDYSNNDQVGVKKIVAYSLLKQIEIEGEEYVCVGDFNVNVSGYGSHNDNNEDDLDWRKINVGAGGYFYVSTVNLDARLDPYRYIRVVGMVKDQTWNPSQTLYCQIQTSRATYHITKATVSPIWSQTWGKNDTYLGAYFHPVLLSCSVPIDTTPTSLSLATTPCGRTERENQFKLSERKLEKNTFTVCVKPLDFSEDISRRLIQWIELNRILGAERIEFYVRRVTKSAWRVLKWYTSTYPKQIKVKRFTKIHETEDTLKNFEYSIWQKRRYEVVAYNNCFYRNIETSQFIVPLDIDEIIVPRKHFTWKRLFKDLFSTLPELKRTFASFTVPNTYFFGKLNDEAIFFLTNLNRSQHSPAGVSGKSFISSKNALTVFNHYAMDVLRPGISRAYFMPSSSVQLNHYKEKCNDVIFPVCKYYSSPSITDNATLKYKELFFGRYHRAIFKMQSLGVL